MKHSKTWLMFGLGLWFFLAGACSKAPNIDEFLVGSWRIKRANIHSIHSFRNNGKWVEQERVEGKFSRIIENKEKVEGNWVVEYEKDTKKLFIVITPSKVGKGDTKWTKDQPFRFEVLNIDKKVMVLQDDAGQMNNWDRVRSSQSDDTEDMMGIAVVNPGPVIVNLKQTRAQDKFRFLCLDMEFSIEDAEGLAYLGIEKDPDTQTATYHLHPVIIDTAVTFFTSLTYRDVKSLDKVKDAINEFKKILSPYFEGRITEVKVNKVVVTAERESVREFEKLYAETYGTAPPEQAAVEEEAQPQ